MHFDYVLVGGGLQNALVAMALLDRRPSARFAIVERENRLGGNHLWCFHAQDLPDRARAFVDPLVAHRWRAYEVQFPGCVRRVDTEYAGVTSERLHQVVTEAVARNGNAAVLLGAGVSAVTANAVVLDDGRRLEGSLVIDSRGPERLDVSGRVAYQKFVGLDVELGEPRPGFVAKLMDACVPQTDGYRFFYVLPFAQDRFLVEDTYFSDLPDLDTDLLRREILSYAERIGLRVARVAREESGVLPLTMREGPGPVRDGVIVGGYAGGWFHPTTGYSFPVALRLALHVASHQPGDTFGEDWDRLLRHRRSQASFFNFLNRMLFNAMPPAERRNVFERFYGLPEETIRRFYAMDVTMTDRARLLVGRPPRGISLLAAMRQVP
jgi:lycopene beta-cyclase